MKKRETRRVMIVRRFLAGESMESIASKLGVSLTTVENHIRAWNKPTKKLEPGTVTASVVCQAMVQFDPDAPVLLFDEDGNMFEIGDIGKSGCEEPSAAALHIVASDDDETGEATAIEPRPMLFQDFRNLS